MLQDLERELPEYGYAGTGREGGNEGEHCAIFYLKSQITVQDTGQFWLSEEPEKPGSKSWDSSLPRICTWAQLRWIDTGEQCIVYNTHLDHVGQTARENGMKLIWRRMQAHVEDMNLPAILTGDFNAYPDNPVVRFLRGELALDAQRAKLKDAYSTLSQIGRTAHEFKGGTEGQPPIDYIFVTPEVEVLSVEIDRRQVDGGYPSDHYPIIAQVGIGNLA